MVSTQTVRSGNGSHHAATDFKGHVRADQVINCWGKRVLIILVRAEIDEKTPRKTSIPTHAASGNQSPDVASLADYFTG